MTDIDEFDLESTYIKDNKIECNVKNDTVDRESNNFNKKDICEFLSNERNHSLDSSRVKTNALDVNFQPDKQVAPLPSPEDNPWKQLPASLLNFKAVTPMTQLLLEETINAKNDDVKIENSSVKSDDFAVKIIDSSVKKHDRSVENEDVAVKIIDSFVKNDSSVENDDSSIKNEDIAVKIINSSVKNDDSSVNNDNITAKNDDTFLILDKKIAKPVLEEEYDSEKSEEQNLTFTKDKPDVLSKIASIGSPLYKEEFEDVPVEQETSENENVEPVYENTETNEHIYENDKNKSNLYENSDVTDDRPYKTDVDSYDDYVNIVNMENDKNRLERDADKDTYIDIYGHDENDNIFGILTDIRFTGPADTQLMSTSFSENNDEQGWESGSDSRSSSSGEFIWKVSLFFALV